MSKLNTFLENEQFPVPLTEDETLLLFDKVKDGDKSAKDKLVKHNMKLILKLISTRYSRIPCEKDELVLSGSLGLSSAINTYDVSKNIKFSTYATKCINNEISKYVTKMYKEKGMLYIEDVIFDVNDDSELNYKEVISSNFNVENDYEQKELVAIVNERLEQLESRERSILTMYFGFNNTKCVTMQEIAENLGISRSYVAKIMKEQLYGFKVYLVKKGIIDRKQLNNSNEQFYLPKLKRKDKVV